MSSHRNIIRNPYMSEYGSLQCKDYVGCSRSSNRFDKEVGVYPWKSTVFDVPFGNLGNLYNLFSEDSYQNSSWTLQLRCGNIGQNVSTVIGLPYSVTFMVRNQEPAYFGFIKATGGSPLNITFVTTTQYVPYMYNFIANSSTTWIELSAYRVSRLLVGRRCFIILFCQGKA
jgi:hypothetical protein